MPQIIDRGARASGKQAATSSSANVKSSGKSNRSSEGLSVKVVAAAGVLTLFLIVFLIHRFVHPFTSETKLPTKVAPLPGMADTYPYNTKEWQEAYKKGKTTFLSGIPHLARPGTGGAGGAAPGVPNSQ